MKKIIAASAVAIVFGAVALVLSSRWVLRLGGVLSLNDGDVGALVASTLLLSFATIALLMSWFSRKQAFRLDLIAAAITREPEAFASSLREVIVQTKPDLSPVKWIGLKADPASRIAAVSEWEKVQRLG